MLVDVTDDFPPIRPVNSSLPALPTTVYPIVADSFPKRRKSCNESLSFLPFCLSLSLSWSPFFPVHAHVTRSAVEKTDKIRDMPSRTVKMVSHSRYEATNTAASSILHIVCTEISLPRFIRLSNMYYTC